MRKLNVMIVAGLIVAVIGAAVVIAYGRSVDNRIADGRQTVAVLVATANIPAGLPVQSLGSVVKKMNVPRAYLVDHPLATRRHQRLSHVGLRG